MVKVIPTALIGALGGVIVFSLFLPSKEELDIRPISHGWIRLKVTTDLMRANGGPVGGEMALNECVSLAGYMVPEGPSYYLVKPGTVVGIGMTRWGSIEVDGSLIDLYFID